MSRRIVIVGGGIVGTAIAAELSAIEGTNVTVIDLGPPERLIGSTGHAPGFIGQLCSTPVLTELARASATIYDDLQVGNLSGFQRVGALEIATSATGERLLEQRWQVATDAGLPAHLLSPEGAISLAPDLVNLPTTLSALHFPEDGTARASILTTALRMRSEETGARYVNDSHVIAIETSNGRVRSVRTPSEIFPADDVVIAAGIWSPLLTQMLDFTLPLVPVEHPYVYGPRRRRDIAPLHPGPSAFVRWPEHHTYARNHGARFGIGSYDHTPRPVAPEDLHQRAERAWPGALFDEPIARAVGLLPNATRFAADLRLNGVFAMTPDDHPFLGPLPGIAGAWIASAIWITHATGAARALAEMIDGEPSSLTGIDLFAPNRFDGQDSVDLAQRALARYNDIYATT